MKNKKEKQEKKDKKSKNSPVKFYSSLIEQMKKDKKSFAVYVILRILVIAVIIRCIFEGRYESAFIGVLALILFLVPPFIEKNFKIEFPTLFESIVFVFIFCAEILGEIEAFYIKFPFWDTMLHTVNGFMFAAFGFCLVDIFNRSPRFKFRLSPFFLAIVAFCFSMTIGVMWEFFEFTMDNIFKLDMQKDFLITEFGSVYFDETNTNRHIYVKDIVKTVVHTADGSQYVINGGYLEVGNIDTMKDLFVNLIGALVFSFVGYFYIKHRGKGSVARQFIPVFITNDESQKKDNEKLNIENNEVSDKEEITKENTEQKEVPPSDEQTAENLSESEEKVENQQNTEK